MQTKTKTVMLALSVLSLAGLSASSSLANNNAHASNYDENGICIKAIYIDTDIQAHNGNCTPVTKGNGGSGGGGGGPIIEDPTATVINLRCDAETSSLLPFVGAKSDNTIILKRDETEDSRIANIDDTTEMTLSANVDYVMEFHGKFDIFNSNRTDGSATGSFYDCVRGIKSIANSSEVKTLTYLGKNITTVPTSIPDTVTSLGAAFSGSSVFNDSNVSKWNTKSVTDMYEVFMNANTFNQPLTDWDTSNVTNMVSMFQEARSFNSPLDNFDVSKLENAAWMFRYATSFNQPINNWDTSSLINLNGMFRHAESFDQPLDKWNLSNACWMSQTFEYAFNFSQNISNWDVSNVGINYYNFGHGSLLTGATSPRFQNILD